MRNLRGLFWLIALLLAASMEPSAHAQDNPNFDVGLAPFGSYHGGNIDQVSLANGSLNVEIPLISYPQRGGKLKMDFVLEYLNRSGTANTWCDEYDDCYTDYTATIPQFNFFDKDEIGIGNAPVDSGCDYDGWYSNYCHYYIADATGANHLIAPTASGTVPWLAVDASGIKASSVSIPGAVPGSIIDSAGTVYYPATGGSPYCVSAYHYLPDGDYGPGPGFIEVVRTDSNGNEITCSSSGIEDSMGRTIPLPTYSDDSGDFGGCPDIHTDTISTTFFVLKWNPPGIDGDGQYKMKFCYVYDSSETWDGPDTGTLTHMPLLSAVILPNNTAWYFTYTNDTLDNVQQVTLPTGGTISYGWVDDIGSGSPAACADGNAWEYNATIYTRTLDPSDGVDPTEEWQYGGGGGYPMVVTDPAGDDTVHTFGLGSYPYYGCYPYETETQYYHGSSYSGGTLLKTVDTTYSYNTVSWIYGVYAHPLMINLVPSTVITTLNDTSEQFETDYTYDHGFAYRQPLYNSYTGALGSGAGSYTNGSYGQQLTRKDYDFGGSLLRTTTNTYVAPSNSTYLSANLLDLPYSVQIKDGGGTQRAYTTYNYDESGSPSGAHGNQTSIHRWLNTTSGYLVTSNVYNTDGTVASTTDPDSNPTSYVYTYDQPDNYYQVEIEYPTTGSSVTHNEYFKYDYRTGLLTSHKYQNNQYTDYSYDDMFRLTGVSYPDGGSDGYAYTDTTPDPYFVFTKTITGSMSFTKQGTVNGLGQLIQTPTTVSSSASTCPGGIAYVDTTYDSMGRPASVSNADCTSSTSDDEVTASLYDALGRICLVVPPDGTSESSCQTSAPAKDVFTSYSGRTTTVTDQAGVTRKSQVDGLGRLAVVWEDPSGSNYETDYGYDTLNNLTSVSQSSSRSRTFAYDSLSRLTSAANPESGTTTYTYDGDGNVATKTDARSITTTYTYDQLNRLTKKAYSDSTPTAYYDYDAQSQTGCSVSYSYGSYPKPLRTAMCDGPGNEAWSYDPMGRALTDQRITNSQTKTTTYTPNYDGSIYQLTYPSGRTITYAPNYGMPPVSAVDTANSINYATSAVYTPQGTLASLTNGSSLVTTMFYNSRLQPCRISVKSSGTAPNSCTSSSYGNVLDLGYSFDLSAVNTPCSTSFGSGTNNGNVAAITDNITGGKSQNFCYDSLNRISKAQTTSTYSTDPSRCWGETYTIDAWSNLTAITPITGSYSGCTQESGMSISVNTGNRITTSGFGYDNAGNMTSGPSSGDTYTFNAENQMTQAAVSSTVGYVYDGDGKRVEKTSGSTVTKIYWYDEDGNVLDETDGSGSTSNSSFYEYVFFNGKRIARRDSSSNFEYYFTDHLGNTRAVTNASGTVAEGCDYYPYGGSDCSPSSTNNYLFTGKERDSESGLDDFGARYYSSQYGRFMSADPFTVTPGRVVDPQQLNLYSYVRNNPLKHIDPTGMIIDDAACLADPKHCGNDWQKVQNVANQQDKSGNYLHPELHNVLNSLQSDSRTFTLENSKLGAGTVGLFTITNFTADGNDFTRATLQLDFKQIRGIAGVTGSDLVPGFNKYEGLLNAPIDRLAETFGHEGAHGLFSIQNPAEAAGIQQLLNQRDAAMQGQHYPYPPDIMQKIDAANKGLIPTERFAQQEEKIINGELQADKKKQ